ncbi:tRNA 2-selenouridine(34) synthase MnmH [Desulfovibrio sp. OttesenSCG-928-G15]|nr:tRNA 2-selenouridine(34) synthase MnmH [Desulfovibrio sp. OttesenSCG-928-G15]
MAANSKPAEKALPCGSISLHYLANVPELLSLCALGPGPAPGVFAVPGDALTHDASSAPGTSPRPIPLIDARSPGEFFQGHIPGAVNVPLFDDDERTVVGTLYKQKSRESALLAGYGFIGKRMESLGRELLELAGERKELVFVCARGGMRSESLAWLAATLDIQCHVLFGGYKVFRRFVLEYLEQPFNLCALGGKTGSGKTDVLRALPRHGGQAVDLEWLARHRGSAFGSLPDYPQPSTEHFENRLALALYNCRPDEPIWIEDECENLGTVNVPRAFFRTLRAAPLVLLQVSHNARLTRVLREYGNMPHEDIAACLGRIQKRLGGLVYKQALAFLEEGNLTAVAEILLGYYDKAYTRQIENRPLTATVKEDDPSKAAKKLRAIGLRP